MKDAILEFYFNKKMKQKDIAMKLNVSPTMVTRIIKKDSRYLEEKNRRKDFNKQKHNKDIQTRVENKRKINQFKNKNDDLILKNLHNQDALEMSARGHLTNENYRKWNYSAYKYNPLKKRYEFRKELGRSADVPKYIKDKI